MDADKREWGGEGKNGVEDSGGRVVSEGQGPGLCQRRPTAWVSAIIMESKGCRPAISLPTG